LAKKRKKVLVFGIYKDKPMEGMEIITYNLVNYLKKNNFLVKVVPTKNVPKEIMEILRFSPDVLHFTHGPTLKTLLIGKLLQKLTGAKFVVTASRPSLPLKKNILKFVSPNVVFSSKKDSFYKVMKMLGSNVVILPHGIDASKFDNVRKSKKELKRKLFGTDNFVCLHVGHIKKNRGLEKIEFLAQLFREVKFVVIGSKSVAVDEEILQNLSLYSNIQIIDNYVENIAEYYAASDLYLFTVEEKDKGAITLPLSVLEAVYMGVPVLTTRYGALDEYFQEGKCFRYYTNLEELAQKFTQIFRENINCEGNFENTVKSWDEINREVVKYYE